MRPQGQSIEKVSDTRGDCSQGRLARLLQQYLTCEIVDTQKQFGIQLCGREKYSEGLPLLAFREAMTDQVFDQSVEVFQVPKLNQADMAVVCLGFQTAAPVTAEIGADVRVYGLLKCIGKTVKAHPRCLRQGTPSHLCTRLLTAKFQLTRRAPVRVKRHPEVSLRRYGQGSFDERLQIFANLGHRVLHRYGVSPFNSRGRPWKAATEILL